MKMQRSQNRQRIKGNANKKIPYIFCAFALNTDAFLKFWDAFNRKQKSKSFSLPQKDLEIFNTQVKLNCLVVAIESIAFVFKHIENG